MDHEYGWHYLPVKPSTANKLGFTGKSRRVVCTLNGDHTFQCALMPMDDAFFMIVNKQIRERLQIAAGDRVRVELQKDESKYGLPMPKELSEVLRQDPEGNRLFHALTPGKQRSVLYFVGKVRDIDKRIHTALVFIEHLKKNDGKILGDKLAAELKRPMY